MSETSFPSRFVSELPDELVEREGTEEQAITGWSLGGQATPPPGPALSFATGDDVVHASFGDGVVTAVEPGGVIVVRFSGDGAERSEDRRIERHDGRSGGLGRHRDLGSKAAAEGDARRHGVLGVVGTVGCYLVN